MTKVRAWWDDHRPIWPSKILCRLWGHLDPDPNELAIVFFGVTVLKGCSACYGVSYQYEGELRDHPDYDPTPCLEGTCCGPDAAAG